jgi:hypothetical protein
LSRTPKVGDAAQITYLNENVGCTGTTAGKITEVEDDDVEFESQYGNGKRERWPRDLLTWNDHKQIWNYDDEGLRRARVAPPAPPPKVADSKRSHIRRFVLEREEDASGVSGTGTVAEGVVWTSGYVSLTWLSPLLSIGNYHSLDVMLKVHGHGQKTKVRFLDTE